MLDTGLSVLLSISSPKAHILSVTFSQWAPTVQHSGRSLVFILLHYDSTLTLPHLGEKDIFSVFKLYT